MELTDDQRLYLQTIYDYFHANDHWPTYRHIDRVLSQVRRNLDIEEIAKKLPMGFATAVTFNHDLNAEAILSISAIHLCKGSEEDLADFIKVLHFCVERYFSAQEDTVQISSDDLSQHLGMSESSVRKMGLLLKDAYEYPIYHVFGGKDAEYRGWICTLSRNIRFFDGVTSVEKYLEKLHQLRTPSVSNSVSLARPGVDTSMSHDQQNKSGKSGHTDAEPLTIWGKLLNECRSIEETASKIQASDDKGDLCADLTSEEIDGLIVRYYVWYGDCLSILPDDLKDKFRLAYDGDGYSASVSISKFFEKALEYKRSNGRVGYRGMRVYDTEWSYPYDTYFRNPLSKQKQILIEASKRKSKPTLVSVLDNDRQLSLTTEKAMSTITLLFLAANPTKTGKLMLDEEIHAITEKIYASEYRDYLKIESYWAIRPDDLLQSFNRYKPHIVHFSGHGSQAGEIILVDKSGSPKVVSTQALKALFTSLKDNIQAVILNACYSRTQTEAITEVINCAIGMNDAIGDEAAIIFAASFYRALGFGRSIQEAFDQGKVALLLEGVPEENTPELLVKTGVDPSQIVLVSQTPPPPAPILPTGLSGKERKRERLFNAYKIILNAAEEYEAVLHQLGYVAEGETKETRDRRLNTTLQRALVGVNDAMITLTLEDVGTDVKTIFGQIRQAFHSYARKLEYNAQFPNEFSLEDLSKDKETVIGKVAELKKAMQNHLKELES